MGWIQVAEKCINLCLGIIIGLGSGRVHEFMNRLGCDILSEKFMLVVSSHSLHNLRSIGRLLITPGGNTRDGAHEGGVNMTEECDSDSRIARSTCAGLCLVCWGVNR